MADKKGLKLTPEDKKEMDEALQGLGNNIDPVKIMEMFAGFQEGMELAKLSLAQSRTQTNTLIGIHNLLLEIKNLLKDKP